MTRITQQTLDSTLQDALHSRLRKSAEAAFAAEERLIGILKREGLLV